MSSIDPSLSREISLFAHSFSVGLSQAHRHLRLRKLLKARQACMRLRVRMSHPIGSLPAHVAEGLDFAEGGSCLHMCVCVFSCLCRQSSCRRCSLQADLPRRLVSVRTSDFSVCMSGVCVCVCVLCFAAAHLGSPEPASSGLKACVAYCLHARHLVSASMHICNALVARQHAVFASMRPCHACSMHA
jgi:hypothetical protein